DAARGPIGGDGTREAGQRRLGRLVVPSVNVLARDVAAHRADVDDPPPAARQHRPADHLRADEGVRQVQVHQALPVGDALAFDRHALAAAADVVDEDVYGPQFIQYLAARGLYRGGRAHVPRHKIDAAAERRQLLPRRLQAIGIATDE